MRCALDVEKYWSLLLGVQYFKYDLKKHLKRFSQIGVINFFLELAFFKKLYRYIIYYIENFLILFGNLIEEHSLHFNLVLNTSKWA